MGLALSVVNRIFGFFNIQFEIDFGPDPEEQQREPQLHIQRPSPDAIYPAPPIPQPLAHRVGRARNRNGPERRRSRHELRTRNEPEGRARARDEPEGAAGGRNEPEGRAREGEESELLFIVEQRSSRRQGSRCQNQEREHLE